MSRSRTIAATAMLLSTASLLGTPTKALAESHARIRSVPSAARASIITGTISDQRTGAPLAGAQVSVIGTTIGGVTDDKGHYRIPGVPAGTVRLRVRLLGYSLVERTVTVQDDKPATVDFTLSSSPLALDAVVVTGTPGGTQVREIGNAVGRIDAAEIARTSPSVNVQQVIGQRDPGVVVQPSAGMVGAGSAIRIRGTASLSLTNQPIIYVDGVRIDNSAASGPAIRQGRTVSRLNDFNPEDIESIEIIKGPAAATLYGTEASNGVIQILTKRGKSGAPKLDVTLRTGTNYMKDPEGRFRYTYGKNPTTAQVDSFNIFNQYKQTTGKSIFTNGELNNVDASVSGGSDAARYFASGNYGVNHGIVDYNWQNTAGTRLNLSLLPNSKWKLDTYLNFSQNETRFAQAADGFGIWDMLVWSSPALLNTTTKGFRYANPDVAGQVDSRSKISRFTGGVDLRHQTTSWLTQQLKFGDDNGQTANQILFPRVPFGEVNFFGARSGGEKTLESVTTTFNTLDYAATAKVDIHKISTATSAGAQYYRKQVSLVSAVGSNFPTPDVTTIGGAATTSSGETFIENKTLGMYVQEVLGFRNRLFITGAVRGDANSAFGSDFKAAYYPKLSASWVLSEEPFFQPYTGRINSLKLRGAWGEAGQQPDVFAALRLYAPQTGPGGVPVVTPSSFGNPALRPERGKELELGFDLGLFNDRATLTYTHYNKTTTDAIVLAPNRPSSGFPGSTVQNLGKVRNWGNELGLNVNVLNGHRVGWDLGVNYATAGNVVDDLGGVVLQSARVGYPVGGIFFQRIATSEFGPTGALINVTCESLNGAAPQACSTAPQVYWGNSTPTWWGSVTNSVTLFEKLRFGANIDFQGGFHQVDGDIAFGHTTFQNSAKVYGAPDPIFAAYQTVIPRLGLGYFDAGFAKLRELSAGYQLSSSQAGRAGAQTASVTAAWRNVFTLWQAQHDIYGTKIFDSETRVPGSSELGYTYQTVIPPTSQIVLTVRMSY
ncbi:MAG: SusC/RagA family TonB-linked outer membrane protein [bacterium]